VSKEELSELSSRFYVDKGLLRAKVNLRKRKRGEEVGCSTGNKGRRTVMCNQRYYTVSRVIYYLYNGCWPKGVVDHIDGDCENNSKDNLRDISQGDNTRSFNSPRTNASSVFRGVHWFKRDGNWRAEIYCKGKKYGCGRFTCEKEAALAYNYKAVGLGFNYEAFNKVFM
jgi:hypothetical protein